MIGPIIDGKHSQLNILPAHLVLGEAFGGLANPETFLHDKVFVYFVGDDVSAGLVIFILLVEGEQLEPVDQLIIASCYVFLAD